MSQISNNVLCFSFIDTTNAVCIMYSDNLLTLVDVVNQMQPFPLASKIAAAIVRGL